MSEPRAVLPPDLPSPAPRPSFSNVIVPRRKRVNPAVVLAVIIIIIIIVVLVWRYLLRSDVIESDTVVVEEPSNTFNIVPLRQSMLILSGPGLNQGVAVINPGDGLVGTTITITNQSLANMKVVAGTGVTLQQFNDPDPTTFAPGTSVIYENVGSNSYIQTF